MEENKEKNQNGSKALLTIRNIVKLLTLFCLIFVFCPSFLVSCQSEEVKVSAMNTCTGIEYDGMEVCGAHPIMILCLLIPLAILGILFLKKVKDKAGTGFISLLVIIDFIIWMCFRSSVIEEAEEQYCDVETTGVFVWNIVFFIIILLLSLFVLMGKIGLDTELKTVFTGDTTQTLNQMSEKMSQVSDKVTQVAGSITQSVTNTIASKIDKENVMGYCFKCGAPLEYDNLFCTKCGNPIPKEMIENAVAERNAKETEEKGEE